MEVPETRYARSGDLHIAYQVLGDGPFDLVFVPAFVSHVEAMLQVPTYAAFIGQLGSFSRLIRFDKRGTGMSDRVSGAPTLETRMDDLRAVMDAAGSERAAVLGASEGGPMSILFAATYPDRVWALILAGTFPRNLWAPDYPWGENEEEARREIDEEERRWGTPSRTLELARDLAPSADDATHRALATAIRQGASPGAAGALFRMNLEIDVRQVLPAIRVPTLVMNRAEESEFIRNGSRYLAEHISGARHVQLPGRDHIIAAGDTEPVLREIERFLVGAWNARAWEEEPDRVLATMLFTDIVGSTALAAELGDRRWRELMERHNGAVRQELVRYRGREVDTAGDGFFATFDGPGRAIKCACAVTDAARDLGIQIRAGLHTGECELIGEKVGGMAVNIGARIASQAEPGEVVVSSTVKDLVVGSDLAFDDRGVATLKGVPGEWHLYTVRRDAAGGP